MKTILKKLTSRGALACILVCLTLLFAFLVYVVSRDAEIMWSKDGGIRIIPQGSRRIKQLEKVLSQSVSKDEYERLQARYTHLESEYEIARSRVNRVLVAAGCDLSQNEDAAIRKLEILAARSKATERDMSVCLSVIQLEVTRGRTINTNSRAMDKTTHGLYMDIQKFLRCIGVYNGEIDGNQVATCRAVRRFQEESGLAVDGIIGEYTLAAMERAFEQAKSH